MEPKIVSLPDFKVVGLRYFGKNENQEISSLWGAANQRLGEIQHVDSQNAYGVCIMLPDFPSGEFEYIAGLEVTQVENVPEGMVVREVPASQYAVFTHLGSLEKLPATYEYIYRTWIPQSGYQLREGLDFELYNEDFKDFAPDSKFYIYVPIR
jgi:AraC family transcriptional regulator